MLGWMSFNLISLIMYAYTELEVKGVWKKMITTFIQTKYDKFTSSVIFFYLNTVKPRWLELKGIRKKSSSHQSSNIFGNISVLLRK